MRGILTASAALFGQGAPPPDNDNGPADEPGRAVARLAVVYPQRINWTGV